MMRQPVQLPQGNHGTFAAIVAQVLYTSGTHQTADPIIIEREAGFQEDDFLLDVDAYRILLGHGFGILEYTTLRQELLVEGGLDYLMQVYGEIWDAQCEAAFTPDFVALMQHRAQLFIQAAQAAPQGSYARVLRDIGKMDLLAAIGRGNAVSVAYKAPNGSLWPSLVTPPEEGDEGVVGWVYNPGESNHVSRLQLNHFWSRAVPSNGAALIWRR